MTTNTVPFFCYAPQSAVIMEFLRSMEVVPVVMHAITSDRPLRGLDRISFFQVKGHARPVPEDIRRVLDEQGAIIVEIDDTFRRRRLARLHEKEFP